MRWAKTLFDFYIDTSIHVALAVLSLYAVTVQLLDLNFNHYLAIFMGFGTVICYNFVKYGMEAEKYLIVSNKYHRIIQVFSFLCFLPIMYCLWHLEIQIWIAIVFLTLLSGIYALPILPQAKNLRSLGVLKIIIVAMVWTGFTMVLPLLDSEVLFNWDETILTLQRFLFVLALILPFEIRDLKFDAPEMATVPQRLGIKRTKLLGYVLLMFFFGLTFLRDRIHSWEIVTRLFVAVIAAFMIKKTVEKQSKYFASFWVESIPIAWWILFYVFT